MKRPDPLTTASFLAIVLVVSTAGPLVAGDGKTHGTIIPLPDTDRTVLEQYFGRGVIGDPIEALPIDDPTEYVGLENTQVQWVKRVYGNDIGHVAEVEISALNRPGRDAWKMRTSTAVLFGEQDPAGSLVQHTSEDLTQGVLSRYDPPEPILAKGIRPGDSLKHRINVGVYDLSNTKDETHSGYLDLTYTYVGAYKITVPAGTFDSVLFRWDYDGKVGPASVKDSQYWFFVKGIGPAATISRQNISAFLIYNVNTKTADVLIKDKDTDQPSATSH